MAPSINLSIRQVRSEDIPALAHFARWTYALAFGASLDAADLAHHLKHRLSDDYFAHALDQDTILLAEDTGLIGFAQTGFTHVESGAPGDQMLRRLFVHPERQGQGIGSQLMEATFALPRLKNAARLYLDVWERNTGALRLYKRFGFTVIGTVPFVTPSGAVSGSDLLMMRPLP